MVTERKAKRPKKPHDKHECLLDARGRKKAVILPIREYRELLEDLHDLAVLAERRDEPAIPWEEVKRQLRSDGRLRDSD
jgi:hypothetical protein